MEGWFLSGAHNKGYEMKRGFENVHQGKVTGHLRIVKSILAGEFATIMQQLHANEWCDKHMKLSCFIQTKSVEDYAGLWMRIDGKNEDTLQFDHMQNRPINGTTGWSHYSIVLDVPENAGATFFGVMLQGTREIWMDEFIFVEVDKTTPSTNIMMPENMPSKPSNLDFELEFKGMEALND